MKFDINDRVFISGWGAPYDGQYGTIEGISSTHVVNFYIVRLDESLLVEGFKKPFRSVTAIEKDLRSTNGSKPLSTQTGITPLNKEQDSLVLKLHLGEEEGLFRLSKEMWETYGRMAGWIKE
jgi:hypothetical protein